jgi:hypothetical protein
LRKLYPASVEEDDMLLARTLGLTNFSEFVRDCISYFISGTDRELTRSEIRELSKKFAHEKRAALLKQQKITGQTEEDREKVKVYQQKRQDAIDAATKQEIHRITPDRFWKYLDDSTGDYHTIQEDIIRVVSERSGYPVELCDLIAAYRRVTVS